MSNSFSGFPKELFTFLKQLAKNNNREWFNDNKSRYKTFIVEPMCEFISAIGSRFEKQGLCFVADPRPHGGSMFRIYRDTRFSNDKRPYKTHAACHFRHEAGKDAHAPGFYVHLEPGAVFFGGGIWMPPNPILENIRHTIVENPNGWKRIITNTTFKKRFGQLEGEGLKRVPRGYDKDHPFAEDLKRKSFFVMQDGNQKLAQSPQFIKEVDMAFKTAGPLMRYLLFSLGLPYDREN